MKKVSNNSKTRSKIALVLAIVCLAVLSGSTQADNNPGQWVAGDFHQHTTYTDGANPFATVMYWNNQFGLDWWANSEHGGKFVTDAAGPALTSGFNKGEFARFWDDPAAHPGLVFQGDPATSSGHKALWRWQILRDFSFKDVVAARAYLFKPVMQGVEWNVPGHEHCSVGVIAGQYSLEAQKINADAVAQFEYLFDAGDADVTGGLANGWGIKNTINNHAKAVEAAAWLQKNYGTSSWMVPAHVERKGSGDPTYVGSGSHGYNIGDFRDLNNAAPDVCFGFESMPGHQKESQRGGYGSTAIGGGTYGGTGAYAAQVGGLWDALLGEGRHWWLFASSDFHSTDGDFWPGEYQKTYTKVTDAKNPQAIVDGLRSGNSFVVEGDLINALDFQAGQGTTTATMGQTLYGKKVPPLMKYLYGAKESEVTITIRFRCPQTNHNGDAVKVDHIDLIAGGLNALIPPGDPNYSNATNPSANVIATFTSKDWKTKDDWNEIRYTVTLSGDAYFRLRGTNLAPNTPNETDAAGNPLPDSLMGANDAGKAFKDLWFYSNPIFVRLKN